MQPAALQLGFGNRALQRRHALLALLQPVHPVVSHLGGAVQVCESSWLSSLKPPGFNPWTYQVKIRFQTLLFQMQLVYRYISVPLSVLGGYTVGLYNKLNPVDPAIAWNRLVTQPLNL
jgi:hypothetical protein